MKNRIGIGKRARVVRTALEQHGRQYARDFAADHPHDMNSLFRFVKRSDLRCSRQYTHHAFVMSISGTSSPNVEATSVRIAAIRSVGPD
ncbi:MAG: hypothetical protein KH616_15485 [Burkholderia sp.]|nr:hypothetical protein [Burkholderia sp.]